MSSRSGVACGELLYPVTLLYLLYLSPLTDGLQLTHQHSTIMVSQIHLASDSAFVRVYKIINYISAYLRSGRARLRSFVRERATVVGRRLAIVLFIGVVVDVAGTWSWRMPSNHRNQTRRLDYSAEITL